MSTFHSSLQSCLLTIRIILLKTLDQVSIALALFKSALYNNIKKYIRKKFK